MIAYDITQMHDDLYSNLGDLDELRQAVGKLGLDVQQVARNTIGISRNKAALEAARDDILGNTQRIVDARYVADAARDASLAAQRDAGEALGASASALAASDRAGELAARASEDASSAQASARASEASAASALASSDAAAASAASASSDASSALASAEGAASDASEARALADSATAAARDASESAAGAREDAAEAVATAEHAEEVAGGVDAKATRAMDDAAAAKRDAAAAVADAAAALADAARALADLAAVDAKADRNASDIAAASDAVDANAASIAANRASIEANASQIAQVASDLADLGARFGFSQDMTGVRFVHHDKGAGENDRMEIYMDDADGTCNSLVFYVNDRGDQQRLAKYGSTGNVWTVHGDGIQTGWLPGSFDDAPLNSCMVVVRENTGHPSGAYQWGSVLTIGMPDYRIQLYVSHSQHVYVRYMWGRVWDNWRRIDCTRL